MDSELEVEKRLRNLNSLINQLTTVINHAEDSYQQLRRLIKVHHDSRCSRDCFDSFPHPQTALNAKLELVYLVNELTARSASRSISFGRWQALLFHAHNKLEEAEELFEGLHSLCLKYMKRSKTTRCQARATIVKEFQM